MNSRALENDLCELISLGIIEQTLVKAIRPVDKDVAMTDLDLLLVTQGGGNTGADTPLEEQVNYLTYTFINVHCQTACYNMLSFSRRQELHTQIAKWYEEKLEIDNDSDTEDEYVEMEDDEERKGEEKGLKSPTVKKKEATKDYLKVSKR